MGLYFHPGGTEPTEIDDAEAEALGWKKYEKPSEGPGVTVYHEDGSVLSPEPVSLKGKLPEDFPGHAALEAEGVTTYAKVRKQLDTLEEIPGIGEATAAKIREAMNESSEANEEAE
jgi:hypothetical protein